MDSILNNTLPVVSRRVTLPSRNCLVDIIRQIAKKQKKHRFVWLNYNVSAK